jgi:signal transduction histidine kinase
MKFTIYRKMLIGFGLIIFLMILANVYVILEMRGVMEGTSSTFTRDVRAGDLAKQMKEILYDEEAPAQKAGVLQDREYYKVFEAQSMLFTRLSDTLRSIGLPDDQLALHHRIQEGHAWFSDATRRATFGIGRSNDPALDENVRTDTLDALHAALDKFIQANQSAIQNSTSSISQSMIRSSNVAYALSVGAFLVAVIGAVFLTRAITKPIGALIRGTDAIAAGKFTRIEVNTHDEMAMLANAVNEMSARLESIDKMKTEMLHHISHELRTPLQAMTSALNLMTDQRYGTLNSEQVRLTTFLRDGINKITAFSHQFLDISKIESGAMKYNFVHVDLIPLLMPVVEEAKLIAMRKNITLTMNTAPIMKVKADTEKIPQVFSNLLSNAIKYTPENGHISINVLPSKFGVRVSVTDSGVGIAAEDLPNVFTKFYQAKNVNKASSRGTGVGLALVKALVEAHGGRVYAESTVGEGTTFTVELPAVKEMKEQIIPNFATIQQSVN